MLHLIAIKDYYSSAGLGMSDDFSTHYNKGLTTVAAQHPWQLDGQPLYASHIHVGTRHQLLCSLLLHSSTETRNN